MRFVLLTRDVSIQYWLELIGKTAIRVLETEDRGLKGREFLSHLSCVADMLVEPERIIGGKTLQTTTRFYLNGHCESARVNKPREPGDVIFYRGELDDWFDFVDVNVKEDFCKLQLRRENDARIVCFRPTDERPAFTGFGRTKPGMTRPCHQDFSETYVDRKPGTEFINYKGENQIWDGFKPLYLKVQPADANMEPYYLAIKTDWGEAGHITVFVFYNEVEIPPELLVYQFSPRGVGVIEPQVTDSFEASAAIRRFVKK